MSDYDDIEAVRRHAKTEKSVKQYTTYRKLLQKFIFYIGKDLSHSKWAIARVRASLAYLPIVE